MGLKTELTISFKVEYINVWKKNTVNTNKEQVSLLLIVSALQEIIYSLSKDETHSLKYFGSRTEHPSLISKLKKGIGGREDYQILWIRKVTQRIYFNLGLHDQAKLITEIESNIDKMSALILQYPNLEDMQFVNDEFLRKMQWSVLNNSDYDKEREYFTDQIHLKTNCKTVIEHPNVEIFFKVTENSTIFDDSINSISNRITKTIMNDKTILNTYLDLDIVMPNESVQSFKLMYLVVPRDRILVLRNFFYVESEENTQKALCLGLEKFRLL